MLFKYVPFYLVEPMFVAKGKAKDSQKLIMKLLEDKSAYIKVTNNTIKFNFFYIWSNKILMFYLNIHMYIYFIRDIL